MELADVLVLLDRFDGSAADRLELEADGWKLRLRKGAAKAVGDCDRACAAAEEKAGSGERPAGEDGATLLKASQVGTFYASPAPAPRPLSLPGTGCQRGRPFVFWKP